MKEEIIWAAPPEEGALLHIELAGTTFPDAEYRIVRGGMPFYVFEAVLSGKGVIESEGRRMTVQAGDSYFLNRDVPVTYYADKKDPYQKIWVNLSGRLAESLPAAYGIHEPVRIARIPLSDLLEKLHTELKKQGEGEEEALLVHQMIRLFAYEDSQEQKKDAHARAVREWCDRHFAEQVSLSDAAKSLFLSRAQMIRVFRQAYDETPYSYILRRRIETAKQLLRSTSLPLSEIAERLSFSDLHHFTHTFKRREGMSPGAYRKMRTHG